MTIKPGWQGRVFEDFEPGDIFEHPLGRTITQADNIWFTLLTVNNNPIVYYYFGLDDRLTGLDVRSYSEAVFQSLEEYNHARTGERLRIPRSPARSPERP